MRLFIANMADSGSQMLVEGELAKLGLKSTYMGIGEADVPKDLTIVQIEQLRGALRQAGLELLETKRDILVHRIKQVIVEFTYHCEETPIRSLPAYLSAVLGQDYTYLSHVFSVAMNQSIEKFYICNKIERVKELLVHGGITLNEIAYKTRFSSVTHLNSQFKKVTGRTPLQFKEENLGKALPQGNCG